jgi:hypothetical protein
MLALPFQVGCEEEVTGANQTGIEIGFTNCVTVGIWVWIDEEYQGFMSSDSPELFPVSSGSHSLYCRSNAVLAETQEYVCWTVDFSVSENETTQLVLDCDDAFCSDQE